MKAKYLFLILGLLICLSGCANASAKSESDKISTTQSYRPRESANNECTGSKSTESVQAEKPLNQSEPLPEQIPISMAKETITMNWNGESLSRACACLGYKMYFSQWAFENRNSALYEMNIGEDSLFPSDLPVPEGMEVKAIATDSVGHLHLLLRLPSKSSENSKDPAGLIREIDSDGKKVRDVDIPEAIKERYVLWQAFLADSAGNYYIKDLEYMLCISKDGKPLWETDNRSLGIDRSYAAEIVENVIYISYQKNGITCIGEISPADGSLRVEYPLPEISDDDPVMAMGAGTDSTLLLYSSSSGIWAWTPDGSRIEKRADISEAQLPYNEIIVARKFLSDGRLLLVKHIAEGDELAGITYQYIPGGR